MDLTQSLRSECIQVGVEGRDKDSILYALARMAMNSPVLHVYSVDQIYEALYKREKIGSTAFGKGIAIPHCGLPDIDGFVVGILSIPEGADFDSYDGEPTRLLVLIIGPEAKRNEHVSLLSSVSKILDNDRAVAELLALRQPEAVEESFLRHHAGRLPGDSRERCLFHVIVQDEQRFDDVLRVFSSAVEGEISVVEANNAGLYLNRMPMFSAFWNQKGTGWCRIILAVVDKNLCNDVVRRINLEVNDLEHQSGILITVQDLMLVRGSLDF